MHLKITLRVMVSALFICVGGQASSILGYCVFSGVNGENALFYPAGVYNNLRTCRNALPPICESQDMGAYYLQFLFDKTFINPSATPNDVSKPFTAYALCVNGGKNDPSTLKDAKRTYRQFLKDYKLSPHQLNVVSQPRLMPVLLPIGSMPTTIWVDPEAPVGAFLIEIQKILLNPATPVAAIGLIILILTATGVGTGIGVAAAPPSGGGSLALSLGCVTLAGVLIISVCHLYDIPFDENTLRLKREGTSSDLGALESSGDESNVCINLGDDELGKLQTLIR